MKGHVGRSRIKKRACQTFGLGLSRPEFKADKAPRQFLRHARPFQIGRKENSPVKLDVRVSRFSPFR